MVYEAARASNGNNSMRRYEGSLARGRRSGRESSSSCDGGAAAAPLIVIPRQRTEGGRREGGRTRRREAPLTLEIDAPLVLEQPRRRVVVAVVHYYYYTCYATSRWKEGSSDSGFRHGQRDCEFATKTRKRIWGVGSVSQRHVRFTMDVTFELTWEVSGPWPSAAAPTGGRSPAAPPAGSPAWRA